MTYPCLRAPMACLLVAAALSAGPARAATAEPPAGPASAPARTASGLVEQRIDFLHQELGITPGQSRQWDAFARVMRDNARRMEGALSTRRASLDTMHADASMRSYASLARLHADNMRRLAQSFGTLYAALSPAQRQKADELFRHPPARGAASAPAAR